MHDPLAVPRSSFRVVQWPGQPRGGMQGDRTYGCTLFQEECDRPTSTPAR